MTTHPALAPALAAAMNALVWTGPAQMDLRQTPRPQPGPGEVLVAVTAVGICGSELSGYLGQNSLRVPPLVMGHEFSGALAAVGGGLLANGAEPVLGQRVAVNPFSSCGTCESCAAGLPQLCAQRRIVGAHRAGGFAQYVAVAANQCWPLADGTSDVAGALVEPLACAVRAVHHAQWPGTGPVAGQAAGQGTGQGTGQATGALLILGAGTIGLFCLAVARTQCDGPIVVTDRVDARLAVAKAWGATAIVNGQGAEGPARLRAALPTGAAAVIDAVGSDATRALALQLVKPGGRVIYIGLHDEASPLAANFLVRQEIAIQGSFAYAPPDFARALALLEAGTVAPSPAWIDERPLADGPACFAGLVEGSITTPKIILRP